MTDTITIPRKWLESTIMRAKLVGNWISDPNAEPVPMQYVKLTGDLVGYIESAELLLEEKDTNNETH